MVKKLISIKFFIFALFLFPALAYSQDQIWLKDFDIALEQAKKEKKPMVVFITAEWCSYCTMMHNTTFTNKNVITALNKYIRVEINYDQNPELCALWDAAKLPTSLLLNQFGEIVSKESGFQEPENYLNWLNKNEKASTTNISVIETSIKDIQKLFDQFKVAESNEQITIFATILDSYYQQKNKELKDFVITKIIDILQTKTTYFELLLNHSRLETRILASIIIEKLQLKFVYDPWDSTEIRLEQIKIILPQISELKNKNTIKPEIKK